VGQAALPLAHPGDIKVSPDNLLYLLNNGPGTAALYVMRPDGQVVRQAALDGKSDVATGLSFGPDGKLYVADMVGGSILKYDPAGGPPLRQFARPEGGFNNITGLAIAGDGTIYAGELGPRRVNAFSLDGHFIRSYDIACIPWYLALAGDWLDVSCDQGIVSINTRTQTIQKSWVREHDVPLKSPTGLAYGPDGLLYVLDGQSISAYQVQH
jgi:sugar lactone lactonase YvrE